MKTGSASRDAFFNLRVLFGFGLSSVGVFLALMALSINSSSTGVAAGANKGVTIIHSYHNDVSPAMRDVNPWPVHTVQEHEAAENPKISTGFHRDMPDLVVQKETLLGRLAPSIPAPILTFAGIPFPGVGCSCAPPDTNGEVGVTQYVQSVNRGYQVFDKATGASVLGPFSIESVWTGFGGVCETSGLGDPVVLYDQLANRWIISQFAGTSIPTDECIAVSTTSDATGTFNRYAFHIGSNFFDYEKISVWPDAYYMSAIIFDSSGTVYLGPQAYAMDRASMLAGQPATLIAMPILGSSFPPMLPSDLDGSTLPPPGAPNSFVLYPDTGTYRVFHFHVDFAIPANSTFALFGSSPAAGFTEICPGFRNCVPELGQSSANWLDAIGDRLMFRLAYRNFGDHESVVGNFTASSNSVAGIRWFELRGMTAGPVTTFQESTYQPDTTWRFQGSIAMDQQGNMALGYSASDATIFPQLRYTGRLATDPLNSMPQGEAHLFDGTGAQTDTFNRWGDYSDMTIDPVDDCTFWYTTEYYDTTSSFNWRTRIGNFKFAECGGGGMLWYNGDFDGVNALGNEQDTSLGAGQFARVYDDFDVTDSNGWNVTSVYSDNLVSTNITGATWEIRQGISEGDGGSLIASGMTMTPTVTVTGRSGMGLSEFQVEVTGLSVLLPAGSYFLNVTPQGDLTGRSFDSTTSGANCVGTPCGNNQNAFFDSNFFGAVFTSTANFGQPSDFSMGVNGTVNPPPPVITSPPTDTATAGQLFSYQITATNNPTSFNATGLPANLTVDTSTGLISGTPSTAGIFSITLSATNAGGTGTATLTLTVNPAPPVITSPSSTTGTVGQAFTYQITATNSPTSFNATGLPAGITVNTGTGLISGTPSAAGTFSINLSVTNAGGTGTAILTLTVSKTTSAPVITSPDSANATMGQSFSYQITATNSPTSFGASGLPAGLSIKTGTGLISGAATVAGDFSVSLSATNASGTGTAVLTLHVAATVSAPVIISPLSATTTVGELFVYQIVATGEPTSYGATNLPAGLTVDSGGTIIGMATNVGTKQVILSASNAAGTGTATLALDVQAITDNDGIDIISGSSVTGRTGALFTYQVIATGINSAATTTTTALPPGLTIDSATGEISGTPSQDGSFGVEVTVHEGTRTATFSLQLTFTSDPGFPIITSASNVTLIRGQPFSYTITAPNSADPVTDPTTFSISGSLPAGLTFDPATGTISGTFVNRIIKALSGGTIVGLSVPSASVIGSVQLFASNSHGTGTQTLTFFAPLPQLLNISTRMQVLTDDKVLIGGFIITGNAPKKVILRAIGPSLTSFGVTNALADPVLELHLPDMTVVTNDNWKDTQQTEIEATGLQPGSDEESAIVATLAPGVYTAIVNGKNGGTGIGLVEAYDLDQAADSTLANISTRGFVDTGDNVMIGGVIIGGETGQVLVRAIGPELTALGVNGALEDTTLELHDKDGALITSNDDWKETQQAVIEATGLAPKDDRESAILATLAPDIYTAIVRGKDGTTGVALVEVYNVSP